MKRIAVYSFNAKYSGLTLLELLIALTLIVIISFFTIPSFNRIADKYRFQSAILILENDLRYAKKSANQHKTRVSMCASGDGKTCKTQRGYSWENGWIIFFDPKANFQAIPNNLLRVRSSFHSQVTITSNRNIGNSMRFSPGKKYNKNRGNGLANGSFTLCHPNFNAHRVILNIYGRSRSETSNTTC